MRIRAKSLFVFIALPITIGFLNALGTSVWPAVIPPPSPLSFTFGFFAALVVIWSR